MSRNHRIETVQLELIRPGPTHGQLLSPLTPYLALCSEESPVTLHIGMEHWRLLNRLERLRYTRTEGTHARVHTAEATRESELEELGRDMGQIFASIPTLGRELGRALGAMAPNGGDRGLVHLRLVLTGSELSLLPYELLVSPEGYPGVGHPLLLQPQLRIVITREARRGRGHAPLRWNRAPKILFISAAPGALTIPVKTHLQQLRVALEPWVRWHDDPQERLAHVEEHLTHLDGASIEKIRDACSRDNYTHVHILAHGGEHQEAGERRFGLVLCDDANPGKEHVVDGRTVAEALHARRSTGERASPWVVSLATCDSGNVGSVVAPGGSIAYDLHAHGVPWVFASQFPLTKRGSTRLTQLLYEGLLWGEDPRVLLEHVRRVLYVRKQDDHDWASLVAYASTPPDLLEEVERFRSKQVQRAVDVAGKRAEDHQARANQLRAEADALATGSPAAKQRLDEKAAHEADAERALQGARDRVAWWTAQAPEGDDPVIRRVRSECFGVAGSTEKKIAERLHKAGKPPLEIHEALGRSLAAYQRSLAVDPHSHWAASQCLCLGAVLEQPPDHDRWVRAYGIAKAKSVASSGTEEAWARGALAELELLSLYHLSNKPRVEDVIKAIAEHCRRIVEIVGWDDFTITSSRRQFVRYTDWWKNELWTGVAEQAVAALTRPY